MCFHHHHFLLLLPSSLLSSSLFFLLLRTSPLRTSPPLLPSCSTITQASVLFDSLSSFFSPLRIMIPPAPSIRSSASYRRPTSIATTVVAMTLLLLTSSGTTPVSAATATPLTRDQIYAQGGFIQNWVAPMPSSPIQNSDANPTNNGEKYLVQKWATTYHSIQSGGQDISFVSDPLKPVATTSSSVHTASATNSTSTSNSTTSTFTTSGKNDVDADGMVLQLNYPKGSYAPSTGPVMGGAQFYAKPFGDKTPFSKMLVSYDVAFPVGFNWVLAGKLPGIYGGTPYDGCSGGLQSTGANCLTMRMMWRQNGVGEGIFNVFVSILVLLHCVVSNCACAVLSALFHLLTKHCWK